MTGLASSVTGVERSAASPKQKRSTRSREDARAKAQPLRGSLYDEVTARIISELEEGRIPWVQPWSSANASPSRTVRSIPRSTSTRASPWPSVSLRPLAVMTGARSDGAGDVSGGFVTPANWHRLVAPGNLSSCPSEIA